MCADKVELARQPSPNVEFVPGQHGDPDAALPGVLIEIVDGLDIVRVCPFAGKRRAAGAAVRKACGVGLPPAGKSVSKSASVIAWVAPEAWCILTPGPGTGALYRDLRKALRATAAVTDQSHAFCVIRVSGLQAPSLLMKECAVDLDETVFAVGTCSATRMAHVNVHLRRGDNGIFELLAPVSYAASFVEWLSEASLEFGYQAGRRREPYPDE